MITTYWSRSGTLALSELEDRLTAVESLAYGLRVACESRLRMPGKTMVEEGLITLLNLGIQKIIDEVSAVTPDVKADIADREEGAV